MGSILWTILCGLVIGALAKLIMPGKDPGGFIITILLGIVGAFVGSLIASKVFGYTETQGFTYLIFSVIGAIIILALYRLIMGRRTTA
jgi:uncharacterized membrane protein YeaQ/YmgE (transglycosylase-associated protein family)